MINERCVKLYCKDDISKIENYEQAINDKENTWVIHHRLEFTINGEHANSYKELKRLDMYFHRPYFELIFMKLGEHQSLHTIGCKRTLGFKHSEETRKKLREKNKGKTYSDFGTKFKEHYGLTKTDDIKLYNREYKWFSKYKICRWENKQVSEGE